MQNLGDNSVDFMQGATDLSLVNEIEYVGGMRVGSTVVTPFASHAGPSSDHTKNANMMKTMGVNLREESEAMGDLHFETVNKKQYK